MNKIITLKPTTRQTGPSGDSLNRLKKAVANMDAAYSESSKNIREFQGVMNDLEQKMNTLEKTCEAYLRKLGKINTKPLYRRSKRLMVTMNDWRAQSERRPVERKLKIAS
jgi:hypothetical protein